MIVFKTVSLKELAEITALYFPELLEVSRADISMPETSLLDFIIQTMLSVVNEFPSSPVISIPIEVIGEIFPVISDEKSGDINDKLEIESGAKGTVICIVSLNRLSIVEITMLSPYLHPSCPVVRFVTSAICADPIKTPFETSDIKTIILSFVTLFLTIILVRSKTYGLESYAVSFIKTGLLSANESILGLGLIAEII